MGWNHQLVIMHILHIMLDSFEKAGEGNFQKCERYNSGQKHVFVSSYSVPNMAVLPKDILGKIW